jgi:predicted alpha/beta superfamily hydrolase
MPAVVAAQSSSRQIELGVAHTIRSALLAEDREVVVLPESYARTAVTYPVLFLLDGSSHLLHGAATTRFLASARSQPWIPCAAAGRG